MARNQALHTTLLLTGAGTAQLQCNSTHLYHFEEVGLASLQRQNVALGLW